MRLAPFADFIKNVVLSTGRPGWLRAATRLELKAQAQDRRKSRRVSFTSSAEVLESRQLLAGPQLVNIAPNTGGFLTNGQIRNEAPRELVFTFSPGATIDASTIDAGITVTRAGTDGIVGSGDDIQIPKGYIGVGPLPNQVTLRFADSLVDDQYRVSINGNLQNSLGQAFNNGTTQNTDFRIDFGGQVVSVVPQPVLRASVLTIADASAITDGDRVSVSAGSSPVTFQFRLIGGTGVVAAGNVAVNYNLGDSATTLASRLSSAIQSASDDVASPLYKRIFPSAAANRVTLSGAEFSPVVGRTLTNATFLTASDGGLTQAADTVVVYFNQNPLVQALAENPAYYQVFDVATGKMYLPQTVRYDAVGNTAVLQFSADLPKSTFHIQIGAPNVANDTLGNAVNLGTLYVDGGINTLVGFIGDRGGISSDVRDFDLYSFRTGANGTSGNASVFGFDSSFTTGLRMRLFDANGTPISFATNSITFSGLTPNTQYYIGVSGSGNNSYSPVTGVATQNGVGTGSYKLQVVLDNSIIQNNDTSSFDTATQLGVLGANGFQVDGEIKAPGNQAYPPLPGGSDEPGHREIPVGGETNDAGSGTTPTVPTGIPKYFYNFQSIYGTDPQGNTLLNGITDAQKQRAREVLEIYSRYLGIEFVETASQGLTIVTGDPRAADPTIPVGAVGGIAGGGLAIMNGAIDWGASEFGGAWFGVAFHEIGHSLGLAHNYDAPGVMGSGFETPAGAGASTPVEVVYPGDINLVAAQRLIPASSTDVNLYQFDLTQNGTINARTIAQQLLDSEGKPAPSLLDPVLSIYSETYVTAKLSSDFGTLNAVKLGFVAKQSGVGGNAIRLVVTKAALGTGVAPQVSVNGMTINIVLNTAGTTAQTLVNTLNANAAASALVTASVDSGVATTNIAAPNTTYSPLSLTGGATNRTLVARNDDYFGRDSLLNLRLDKGRYYAAISSTGNTSYNPVVPGTGFGGRTDGIYQLSLNFTADALPSETLNDIRGVALDGDLDTRAGGTFDFWFKTGDTIFVDKANFNDVAPDGTTAHPYSNISQALALAQPGQIVRIVGNGGLDGDAATINDNRPYLIGFDSQGADAEDGANFIVPKGVTVMIDAGAIIKLKGAIIDVGKTLPNIDRSGAALQVLGTPKQQVQFTSLGNDSIGGRSDSNDFVGPEAGNWGGIVFRQSSDFLGINGKLDGQDFQHKGVFLNSVNQASFSFGGGQVFDDSVLQVFNPVHVENLNSQSPRYARPNIWFNNITSSADAAMSADPNSFANTVDRSGPFIRGNKVAGNSVNGMFIRVRTNFGQPIDSLQVPARI
ncbi:MAG: hypothetical protein NT069_22220, partial [Planctomycetota bacterium]|nr:hypothetical protein [Planctomycetota bacterium]